MKRLAGQGQAKENHIFRSILRKGGARCGWEGEGSSRQRASHVLAALNTSSPSLGTN